MKGLLIKDYKLMLGQKSFLGDTGSPEVQIAIWTAEINNLIEHFNTHAKDTHSRLGLMKKVSRRRHLLDYLKGKSESRYQDLIKKLDLRK